ncbi:MAG: S46 family peptidase [Bacteroidia bacterium]|nr:S46 family peptidase [Bacteroidia bacterium]MCC6768043.1 S46 family peptidase [Bacteroidia bacterium]
MKRIVIALLLPVLLLNTVKADEGMWLPLLVKRLNHTDMKKLGCKLTAEEIYDINRSSLKDAVVMLSGGSCSAEAISNEGLLLTNHHCGYEAIQTNSTVSHDYLADGFWAKTRADELPSGGITASFLVRIEDVSAKVLAEVNPSMSESERTAKVRQISQTIEKEAVSGTTYNAAVKSFFDGNEYYLFVYETFKDVRLVGAPPESVGKFGGDTDNWMWPRQTGDFCLLRVYAGPDNKPAEFSPENVPYKPRHFLPISLDGVKDNDFTMVMGYPGRTDRYLTSYGVQMALDLSNPAVVKIRGKKLDIMKEDMDASKEVRIKYASTYAQTANYWKYFIGQSKQLKGNGVVGKKVDLENQFRSWAGQDPQRQAKYGTALQEIEKGYNELRKYNLNRTYLNEAILQGPAILMFAYQFEALKPMLADSVKRAQVMAMADNLKAEGETFYKDYNQATDKKLFIAMLKMFEQDIPAEHRPSVYDTIRVKYNGSIEAYANDVYAKSIFASKDAFLKFLDKPEASVLEKDLGLQTSSNFLNNYLTKFKPVITEIQSRIEKGNRLFVAGLREMQPEKKFYPNANSTMRLSYGQVKDYIPRDGVMYEESTTLKGVMEKEDPNNDEFIVPAKLKELYQQKNYGIYANKQGEINTCFISTNDITGGNSGSPVINGKGQLIGCAFDGNWEAMSGDIFFEKNIQRTISVDIRYVLFLIDKLAGAGHIVDEMKLMRGGKEVKRNG